MFLCLSTLSHTVLRFTVIYKLTHSCTRPIDSSQAKFQLLHQCFEDEKSLSWLFKEATRNFHFALMLFGGRFYGFIDRTASEMTGNRWPSRNDTQQRAPGRDSNPGPLQRGQSCSTNWANGSNYVDSVYRMHWHELLYLMCHPPQNSSSALFQFIHLSDLDTSGPCLKTQSSH